MRTVLIRPALLIAALAAVPALAAGTGEPRLQQFTVQGNVTFAASPDGGIACWLRDRSTVLTWNPDGTPRARCTVEDARVPNDPNVFAYNDGRAALTFFDFVAGSEQDRRGLILDTDRCRIEATFAVQGVVHALGPAGSGWVAVTREPFEPGSTFLRLDRTGKLVDALSLDGRFAELARERPHDPNPLDDLGNPVVIGRDLWIIPHTEYELWYPPQRGRPFHRLTPPSCLANHARELSPDENAALQTIRAKGFPQPYRTDLEAAALSSSRHTTMLSATAGFALLGDHLAVKIMDPRIASGARVDVWDLTSETVIAVLPFPTNQRLIAIDDTGVWVMENGTHLARLPMPRLGDPVGQDACVLLRGAIDAASREVAGEIGRPAN